VERTWKNYHISDFLFKKRDKLESELELNLGKKIAKCYIWSIAKYVAETTESSTEIPGKF
jgi:hypothetical protein